MMKRTKNQGNNNEYARGYTDGIQSFEPDEQGIREQYELAFQAGYDKAVDNMINILNHMGNLPHENLGHLVWTEQVVEKIKGEADG